PRPNRHLLPPRRSSDLNALLSLQKPKNFALIKIDELSRIQVLDCQIFISFTKPAKDNLPRPDVLAFLVYESPSRLYLPQTLSSRDRKSTRLNSSHVKNS